MGAQAGLEGHVARLLELADELAQRLHRERLLEGVAPRGGVAVGQLDAAQQRLDREVEHEIEALAACGVGAREVDRADLATGGDAGAVAATGVDIDLQAEDSDIYVDEMHITNVLFNLLDNAVKYRRLEVPLTLMCRTWNENGKLLISIEDNGIGIKKEYLKKVFDRFFRVPTGNVHDVKGFGLGLAYARKIVEDHKGTIRAEVGTGNVGTKFIITLPLIKS